MFLHMRQLPSTVFTLLENACAEHVYCFGAERQLHSTCSVRLRTLSIT